MKKFILHTLFSLLTIAVTAQVDRTTKPEAGPAKEIKIGDYEKFTLKNGLTVIVVENHKIPRVSYSLIIDRDPLLEKDKVGYISMAGQMLRRGTSNRNKDQLDQEIDFIGATLSTSGSSIFASSLTKHQDKLLDLMTDVLFNPTFPKEELEKIKKQTIDGLKASIDEPDYIAGNVKSVLMYGKDHPYGELQLEEHVENIQINDLESYYNTYFKPNISYLAIVGDITAKEAKKIAKKRFGKWEKADVPTMDYEVPQPPKENQVALVNRSASVQTVLSISYPIELEPGSDKSLKASVMNQILGGRSGSRLFKNIREDKGYTYDVYSSISSDELVGNFNAQSAVRTEVTDSAATEFFYEMDQIRTELVSEQELQLAKNVLIGGFGRALERPQTVATFAVNIERYGLSPDYYNNYTKNIQAVTAEEVKKLAMQYVLPENCYLLAVGKINEFADKLSSFGTINYYDIYGNEVDPAQARMPEGLTADQVFEDYFEALGGKQKMEAVQSIKMEMTANAMGQVLSMSKVVSKPKKLSLIISMGGNVMTEQVYNEGKAKVTRMGQNLPMDEATKSQLELEAFPFPILHYDEMKVQTKLSGVGEVNGMDTYIVEVSNPDGKTYSLFFGKDSGLLLRKSESMQGPDGKTMTLNTDYDEYQEIDGLMFPKSMKIPLGPGMQADAAIELVEINSEISPEIFTVE